MVVLELLEFVVLLLAKDKGTEDQALSYTDVLSLSLYCFLFCAFISLLLSPIPQKVCYT